MLRTRGGHEALSSPPAELLWAQGASNPEQNHHISRGCPEPPRPPWTAGRAAQETVGHKLQTQNKMQKQRRASRRGRFCDPCGQRVPKTVRLGWPQRRWTRVFLQVSLTLRQRWSWRRGLSGVGGSQALWTNRPIGRACLCVCVHVGVCMYVRVWCVRVRAHT